MCVLVQPCIKVKADVGLTVTGSWSFFDRFYNSIPAEKYIIEIYEKIGEQAVFLKAGVTDNSGNYSIQLTNHPGNVVIFVMILTGYDTDDIAVIDGSSELYGDLTGDYQLSGNEDRASLFPDTVSEENILDAFWKKMTSNMPAIPVIRPVRTLLNGNITGHKNQSLAMAL